MSKPPLPAPTVLERAIAYVAPGAALRRLRSRAVYAALTGPSGYDGARSERPGLRRYRPAARTANEDTLPDLEELRARSRDLARNAPVAGGALRTVTTSAVGEGLRVRPAVDRRALVPFGVTDAEAEAFEDAARREFALFARKEHADQAGAMPFAALQSLAFRSVLESGDAFAALVRPEDPRAPFDFCLQLIEADRVSNPHNARDTNELVAGVALTESGRARGYHVREIGPADMAATRTAWRFMPAAAPSGMPLMLHLLERERIGQTRGVPYLAPVLGMVQDLRKFSDAEITAAVLTACIALTTEAAGPIGPLAAEAQAAQAAAGGTAPSGGGTLSRAEIAFEPGLVLEGLQPGESVKSFAPERPNSAFEPFFNAMVSQVGLALELPHEVLLKRFNSSYSASRAALLEAWRFFRARRAWLAREFCAPVYEAVLWNAVLRGRLVAPGFLEDPLARAAWCAAAWTGPSAGQIDPVREVEAAGKRLELRLSTRRREVAELTGEDFEAVAAELSAEEAMMRRLEILPAAPPAATPAAPPAPPRAAPPGQEPPDPAEDPDESVPDGEAEGDTQKQGIAA